MRRQEREMKKQKEHRKNRDEKKLLEDLMAAERKRKQELVCLFV